MNFGVLDTEDDSKELMDAGRSGFDKTLTQVAAVTRIDKGDGLVPGPRFHNRGDARAFKKWLVKTSARHGIVRWYAHNLQYDLGNLFADELDELEMTMVGGRLIRARWGPILFVDSYNLFPTSAVALGKALGLEKLEMDVHSMAYVFRDCDIIALGLEKLIETCNEFDLTEPSNTLGGLCVAIWKAMGGVNPADWSSFGRAAIFGGRVEIFCSGGTGNIAWTDINSLYPSAMLGEFPATMDVQTEMKKFGITTATVHVPPQVLAPLPLRVTEDRPIPGVHENAIIFPCGRFTGTWCNVELRNAVEHHGVIIEKIHETRGCDEGLAPYRDFVLEFYRRRLGADSEAYKLIYKLLMNNLYGQLGMGGTVTRTAVADEKMMNDIRTGRRDATVFGDAVMFDVSIPLPEHVNYSHAAHVTAYGRIALLGFMRKIAPERLIYCDTDSIFFFHPPGEPLPFETGTELGAMKIEGMASEIHVLAPKTYEVTVDGVKKSKAKGVPKKFAEKFIRERSAEYAAPFKMKEAVNFFDRANVDWIKHPSGRMVPVLEPRKRGNARKLSIWRMVSKALLSDYMKKTRQKKTGAFIPLVLGAKRKPAKKSARNLKNKRDKRKPV